MSAVRLPSCTENFHIFFEGLRKHFLYVCLIAQYEPFGTTKLEIISETNNTQRGYCIKKRARIISLLNYQFSVYFISLIDIATPPPAAITIFIFDFEVTVFFVTV